MACAATALPCPASPSPLPLFDLTEIRAASVPSRFARLSLMAWMYGESLGVDVKIVQSRFINFQPWRRGFSRISLSRFALGVSFHASSVSGNHPPMSPMATEPRIASMTAWRSGSPSECPRGPRPSLVGIMTPPSGNGLPSPSGWRSNPCPIRSCVPSTWLLHADSMCDLLCRVPCQLLVCGGLCQCHVVHQRHIRGCLDASPSWRRVSSCRPGGVFAGHCQPVEDGLVGVAVALA